MKKILILASIGALALTSVAAQAEHNWRKRKFIPNQDRVIYLYEDEDDGFVSYDEDDDDEDVIYLNRRENRRLQIERDVEAELWWLEENARKKLETRSKAKKPTIKKAQAQPVVKKPVAKPKTVASAKPVKAPAAKVQTASLSKPATVAKPKPVTKSNISAGKTIGCTAGAAVVTGYGFADVKPRTCTGATYAYVAERAGKSYAIKLTAASGEITDVQKLN